MAVILARVQVRKNKRNEFLKIMREVANISSGESGCERFEIHQHLEDDSIFSFCGIWKTPGDFKMHLKSDQFSLMQVAFKLLGKNPEIYYCKNQFGLDLYGLLQIRETLKN